MRPSALFTTKYKHERIGQSIIQAEVSVFSQTNAQSGFAATIILFLTALAICSYGILRDKNVPRFTAAAGAFLPTIFQAITRLSMDACLSQTATLFFFVFLTHVLLRRDLNARSFTLFFSLGLAYLHEKGPVRQGCVSEASSLCPLLKKQSEDASPTPPCSGTRY